MIGEGIFGKEIFEAKSFEVDVPCDNVRETGENEKVRVDSKTRMLLERR
ncbi:MAG: hypothetical protein KAV42_02265 [Candidatus Krumholzibacteria bacterium]|nr:hypothetical protein [Candidatus Krumholzibacteria bacterium]